MVLEIRMREGLNRQGVMHLNFVGFFGNCTKKSTIKELLKTLLKEYFPSETFASVVLNENFDKAIKEYREKYEKSKLFAEGKILENLENSQKILLSLCGFAPDKVIEYMNDYVPVYEKSFSRFYHEGYACVLDPSRVFFCYETNNNNLKASGAETNAFFLKMFDELQDVELEYEIPFSKLKTLGKSGYLEYTQAHEYVTWCPYPYLKFLNKNENVEIGFWKNSQGHPFVMLNQSDRFMLLVSKRAADDENSIVFNIEEFADEI